MSVQQTRYLLPSLQVRQFEFLAPSSTDFWTRQEALFVLAGIPFVVAASPLSAVAYTPDSDPLRESLYLISRAQEATVQQERFAKNGKGADIKQKMRFSLRLVEKSYRLLDQINYASQFVYPSSEIITATEAGNEAVDALQSAIDFAKNDLGPDGTPLTDDQRAYLIECMQTTRNKLFTFVNYMPQQKLEEARLRIEKENVDNRNEFDGADDAGVYNPVELPWKKKQTLIARAMFDDSSSSASDSLCSY